MKHDHERGFTLVEVLVTLAILSLALTGFYGAVAAALQTQWVSEDRSRTLHQAHALLQRVGADLPVRPADGTLADGKRWRITVSPLAARSAGSARIGIFWVSVIISDRLGRESMRLETARWSASL